MENIYGVGKRCSKYCIILTIELLFEDSKVEFNMLFKLVTVVYVNKLKIIPLDMRQSKFA